MLACRGRPATLFLSDLQRYGRPSGCRSALFGPSAIASGMIECRFWAAIHCGLKPSYGSANFVQNTHPPPPPPNIKTAREAGTASVGLMLGGGRERGLGRYRHAMCDNIRLNSRTRVKLRSPFSILTLLSIVDAAQGGRGRRWRSERMHRVGARAARCLGRCGRHERAIFSPISAGHIHTEIARVSRSSSSRTPIFQRLAVAAGGGVG